MPKAPATEPALSTTHRLLCGDARAMDAVASESVELVLTSPPYPMIAMWDEAFGAMAPASAARLAADDGPGAFAAMHAELDRVWAEVARVLVPGGIAAINIGDAVRTIAGQFALYPNHARILAGAQAAGLQALPGILWRKPTNAPNKFMGSGMLPPGAYMTLEHEHILILRKGPKRLLNGPADKSRRQASAFFWHERNLWFSDVWMNLIGARQDLADPTLRERSAAFPFELAWRLVHMFSLQGDTVLDPFSGTATTTLAAMGAQRHSLGVDLEPAILAPAAARLARAFPSLAERVGERLTRQAAAMQERAAAGKVAKHRVLVHDLPCMSAQERGIRLALPAQLAPLGAAAWEVHYTPLTGVPAPVLDNAPSLDLGFEPAPAE